MAWWRDLGRGSTVAIALVSSVAVAALLFGFLAWPILSDRLAGSSAATQPPQPTVLLLGDETTGCDAATGCPADSWPGILAAERGWDLAFAGGEGEGYVHPGKTGTLADHTLLVAATQPDLVLIAGGGADRWYAPTRVEAAAKQAVENTRGAAPMADVVVIGPLPYPDATAELTQIAQAIAAGANAAATDAWIDPIARGWPADEPVTATADRIGGLLPSPWRATTTPAGEVIATEGGGNATAPSPTATCTPATVPLADLVPAPEDVVVGVYNAAAVGGLAAATAGELTDRGFQVAAIADDPDGRILDTVGEVRYGPAGKRAAQLLRQYAPGAELVRDDRESAEVWLILGRAFDGLAPDEEVAAALERQVAAPGAATACEG